MSDSHLTHHGHAGADDKPFTDLEIQTFHNQDYSAARAVVILMCGIFTIGVVIYSIVAYTVAS